MESILLVLTVGFLCLLSFYLGARLGSSEKAKEIKFPTLNPVTKIKEIEEAKDEKREKERLDIIRQNIDNYDGTSEGQKDIPY